LGALLRFGLSSKFFVHLLVFDTIVAAAALLPNDLDLLVCSLHIYKILLVYGKHRILKKPDGKRHKTAECPPSVRPSVCPVHRQQQRRAARLMLRSGAGSRYRSIAAAAAATRRPRKFCSDCEEVQSCCWCATAELACKRVHDSMCSIDVYKDVREPASSYYVGYTGQDSD